MSSSPVETPEPAPRPAKRRRWWLWAVLPWVVVLGMAAVRWYDNSPAHYQVVAQYTSVDTSRVSGGILAQPVEGTYILYDYDGHQRWQVKAMPFAHHCTSRDGHFFALLDWQVNGTAVVSTWCDGRLVGIVSEPYDPINCNAMACANNGRVFLYFSPPDHDDISYNITLLVEKDHIIAHGCIGAFGYVSPDGTVLIDNVERLFNDGECRYGNVSVSGDVLSASWGATTLYDGRYGPLVKHIGILGLGMSPWIYTPGSHDTVVTTPPLSTGPRSPRGAPSFSGATAITVTKMSSGAGWTLPLPRDSTAAVGTDDGEHVLIGYGGVQLVDTWKALRKWPGLARLLPASHPLPLTLSLYDNRGRQEAVLPYQLLYKARSRPAHVMIPFSIHMLYISSDGTRLVYLENPNAYIMGKNVGDPIIYFVRADPHPSVWGTITGWFKGKG